MRQLLSGFFGFFESSDTTDTDGQSRLTHIPELKNLQTLGTLAKQKNLPIMLAFGAEWCEFCKQLKSEVLDPMALGGDYEGKYMFMRYVSLDDPKPIPNFDGKPILKSNWADQYNVDLTPTVLFVDGNGKEVAPRMVGIPNIEFYSSRILRALNQAYAKMGNPMRVSTMPKS